MRSLEDRRSLAPSSGWSGGTTLLRLVLVCLTALAFSACGDDSDADSDEPGIQGEAPPQVPAPGPAPPPGQADPPRLD